MEKIDKYTIVGEIGEGGMGRVYHAVDPVIGRRVAIKTISLDLVADIEVRARFVREAQAAGQLSHPNLITIHDIGISGRDPFIVMELLEGSDLAQKMRAERMPFDVKIRIMTELCEGLAFAHEHGVVHRDIKPANIFITTEGRVKILDFGLARLAESDITRTGRVIGTPDYMAPEQIRGEAVDQRADVFSAGVVFYELMSGRKAFEGDSAATLMTRVLQTNPPAVHLLDTAIPAWVSDVVERAIAKDKNRRYQTARDLLDALRTTTATPFAPVLASRATAPATPPAASVSTPAATPRRWSVTSVAAMMLLAVTMISGLLFVMRRPSASVPRTRPVLERQQPAGITRMPTTAAAPATTFGTRTSAIRQTPSGDTRAAAPAATTTPAVPTPTTITPAPAPAPAPSPISPPVPVEPASAPQAAANAPVSPPGAAAVTTAPAVAAARESSANVEPTAVAAVENVLARYQAALEARDIGALKRVWPALGGRQEEAMRSEFEHARAIAVTLEDVDVRISGSGATISGRRDYRVTTSDGRDLRTATHMTMALVHRDGAWVIDAIRHDAVR